VWRMNWGRGRGPFVRQTVWWISSDFSPICITNELQWMWYLFSTNKEFIADFTMMHSSRDEHNMLCVSRKGANTHHNVSVSHAVIACTLFAVVHQNSAAIARTCHYSIFLVLLWALKLRHAINRRALSRAQ